MKKFFFPLIVMLLCLTKLEAQNIPNDVSNARANEMKPKLGLKAGYNFARVIGIPTSYKLGNNKGFMIGAFYSPTSSGRGYRTELIFSSQGFSYSQDGKMQNVRQDYILMPQLYTFTVKKVVQLQVGGQFGYLLNAQNSSAANQGKDTAASVTSYLNRFDYGAAGGIEIYPSKGLLIGGRYNVSFGNLYKRVQSSASNPATSIPLPLPFNPQEVKGKNAVVQFYIGYRF